jgi:hypothetical protein
MNRQELIKLLFVLQNEAFLKSGLDFNDYPFVCFDFCSDAELKQHHHNLGSN